MIIAKCLQNTIGGSGGPVVRAFEGDIIRFATPRKKRQMRVGDGYRTKMVQGQVLVGRIEKIGNEYIHLQSQDGRKFKVPHDEIGYFEVAPSQGAYQGATMQQMSM